jgi:hypothetical protein
MGKLIIFPGANINVPSRSILVERLADMMLREVTGVFVDQRCEIGSMAVWHQHIRDYFWRSEIRLQGNDFREQDLVRWRSHWRDTALRFVEYKLGR